MPTVEKEIVVAAPVSTVYQVWHNFENFPKFMDNIEEVRVVGGNRSHWRAKGPLGQDAEWDAEMTLDEPDRSIGWRSIEGNSAVNTAGRVNFDALDGATKVRVTLHYESPAGAVGDIVTKIFSNPERQIEEDLQRFRRAVESRSPHDGDESLGGSLGAVTENDLKAISRQNSGVEPESTDDPAVRKQTGADFGHSSKDLPEV